MTNKQLEFFVLLKLIKKKHDDFDRCILVTFQVLVLRAVVTFDSVFSVSEVNTCDPLYLYV